MQNVTHTPADDAPPPLLKIDGIAKAFDGVLVLNNIHIEVAKGEILGIIGENGAGKSTLLKILAGIHPPTRGTILIEGRTVSPNTPRAAGKLGITMIPQEFNLVDTLAVFENIFLGHEKHIGPILAKGRMKQRAREALDSLGADIAPTAVTGDLSVAGKQMVEIAKALCRKSRILIMDEPTTALSERETEVLFSVMKELKRQGVMILFVSHRLEEVRKICDRVLVLRDGYTISIADTAKTDVYEMAKWMVGRELNQVFPEKIAPDDEVVLRVDRLGTRGTLHNVTFELKKGEVLGVAGLGGSGRTELAETVMGLRRRTAGTITVKGRKRSLRSPRSAVRSKLGFISEDRQRQGLIMDFQVPPNITLANLRQYSTVFLRKSREKDRAREYAREFGIKSPDPDSPVRLLSGGNQQKVYVSKWMDTGPEILILDEPTRGIDVNAKRDLYYFIQSLAKSGISCILISSELEEVIGMCRRVMVMREGTVSGVLEGEDVTEENVMRLATGIG